MVRKMKNQNPEKFIGVLTAVGLTLFAGATLARAHAGLEQKQAPVGTGYKIVVKIPHGCEGSATTAVHVSIPEGVIGVKPMPKPGWQLSVERGAYERAYQFYHGDLKEGVRQVSWSGGNLPDAFYDEFVMSSFVARELEPGQTLHFPVTQTCEKGQIAWDQIPQQGQDPHALERPAPGLMLVAAENSGHHKHHHGKASGASTIEIEKPWTRATPAAATVAAGYVTLKNVGKEADKLIGGSVEGAASVEVHTMSNDNGVMKMRHLEAGLELPPGETVTLKPGGLHLMMMGLNAPFQEGGTLKGKLKFEKAGDVDVEFAVQPIGSSGPEDSHDHHSHH